MHDALKYALPILLVSLISSGLVLYGWVKKNTPMGKSYSIMMLVLTLWLVFFSMGLLTENLISYKILATLEYLMTLFLPLCWIIFTIIFSGNKKWLNTQTVILLSLIPAVLLVVALSPEESGLLFNHFSTFGLRPPFDPGREGLHGWGYFHAIYSLVYFIYGTYILLKSLKTRNELDISQLRILVLGVIIPWIGNITFIFRVNPFAEFNLNLDLAPFIFVLSSSLIAWSIFFNRIENVINLAYSVLIERMADALIILDNQNWILEINLPAVAALRVRRDDVVGHPVSVIINDFPSLKEPLKLNNGKNIEVEIQSGGRKRYFNLDIMPLYADKGLYAGKILLLKEITTLVETARRLAIASDQAKSADNLKSAFLANLSHEIKTPMNAIIGFSDLLNDDSVSDEERHEFIDHIRNSGSTLMQLIDDIVDISKMDAGQLSLVKRDIDISKMMAEMFARINEHLTEEGKEHIDLILETDQLEKDLHIIGDPDRIRQVLLNLLTNAVKFTREGEIRFGYHLDENQMVQFYVKDTGVGIPYDKQSVVFERFGRVHSSNKQEYSGTGLGLSLCKGLVNLMGGKIWFSSIFGKGSTFSISVPYIAPEKEEEMDVPGMEMPPPAAEFITRKETEPVSFIQPAPVEEEEIPEPQVESQQDQEPEPESIRDHIQDLPEEAGLIFTPDTAPKITMEDESDFSGTKILVMEFDDMSYLFIEMILRPTRVQLIRAKTLKQGLNLLSGGTSVAGVIVSSEIGDEELLPAIKRLREKYPKQRLVAITPFASTVKRAECVKAGCYTVLPKPLKQRELLSTVRNLHTLSKIPS